MSLILDIMNRHPCAPISISEEKEDHDWWVFIISRCNHCGQVLWTTEALV